MYTSITKGLLSKQATTYTGAHSSERQLESANLEMLRKRQTLIKKTEFKVRDPNDEELEPLELSPGPLWGLLRGERNLL